MNKNKNIKNITLNLPCDLSQEEWGKVQKVFTKLDGWMNDLDYAYWYGKEDDDRYIISSVEAMVPLAK